METFMNRFILLCTVLLISAGIANADEPSSVYAGAALGTTDFTLSCVSGPCDSSQHRVGGKLYIGYTPPGFQWANPGLVNSFELMAYSAGANDGGYPKASGGGDKIRFRGVGVVDSLSYSVDAFALTGRLGVGYTRASLDFGGGGYRQKEKLGVLAGVGVSFAVNNRWTVKADIDQVPATDLVGRKSLNLFSLGAAYRF
jgi:opacity protein-like surface antigen